MVNGNGNDLHGKGLITYPAQCHLKLQDSNDPGAIPDPDIPGLGQGVSIHSI